MCTEANVSMSRPVAALLRGHGAPVRRALPHRKLPVLFLPCFGASAPYTGA